MTDYFRVSPDEQIQRLAAAGRAALAAWDIADCELKLIKYRENAVFRVDHDGGRAALRLHRPGYHTNDELNSELQWMQALSEAGIKVPTVIPATNGELFVHYEAPGLPGELQIDLFEWIDGAPVGSSEDGIENHDEVVHVYSAIGELAAKVHNHAVSWDLPVGFVRHAWDADGLAGEQPFWGRFWDLAGTSREEKDLLTRGRERVHAELRRVPKSPGHYSLIHADFAPENVMREGDEVRLIDFDDAGFGWHLFELATSLYFIQDEPYAAGAKAAWIDGYRKHRQLTDAALETLPLFMLARGFTYIGWVHTRHETETAREMTPMLLAMVCKLADEYLRH